MEPVLTLLFLGLFGGLVLSLAIARNRRGTAPTFVPTRLAAPTPALINMSNIRVEGIGGLGMVAAVIAVAIADSRIRVAIIIAAALGGGLALALIALRRRGGPLPSAGDGPDDRSMLHIDRSVSHRARTAPSPHEAEDAGCRSSRIGVARILDFVTIRHRCPVGVDRPTIVEALGGVRTRGFGKECVGVRRLDRSGLVALWHVFRNAIAIDVGTDPRDVQQTMIGLVGNHPAKL